MKKKIKKILKKTKKLFQKPAPAIALVISLIFAYNLFIKKRIFFKNSEENTVTLDLKYFGNDITFLADKVIEKGSNKSFYNVDIKNDKGNIKAGYANAESKNDIIFKEGVVGNNDKWSFESEEARYISNKNGTIINLYKKVDAYNESQDIRIKTDNFRLTNDFTTLQLNDNCVVENDKVKIKCEKGDYKEDENIFYFNDNVVLETYRDNKGYKEPIFIESSSIEYDLKNKKAKSDKPFLIKYQDFSIKGVGFEYVNDKFKTDNRIKILNKKEEIEINADHGDYEDGILLKGNVNGKYKDMEFEANNIRSKDGVTTLSKNVLIKSKDRSILCDKLEYKNEILIASAADNLTFSNKEYELKSKILTYNTNSKDIICDADNVITNKDSTITSSYFLYNEDSEIGHFRNMILEKKNQIIDSKNVAFDLKNNKYILEKGVKIIKDSLTITPEILIAIEDDISLPGQILIDDNKSGANFIIRDGKYNKKSNIFISEGKLIGEKGDYKILSGNLTFNNKEGIGYLKDEINIKNKKNNFNFKADNGTYMERDGSLIMPNPVGKRDDIFFEAKESIYLRENSILKLINKVKISKKDLSITSEEMSYDMDRESLSFEEESNFHKGDFLIISKKGNLILSDESIQATNVVLIKDEGDIVEADYLEADKKLEKVSVKGNVKGDLVKRVKFTSDSGNLFFMTKETENKEKDKSEEKELIIEEELDEESIKNKYKLTRAELHYNIHFKYKDMDITSDYLEFDNGLGESKLELVFAKNNLKFNTKTIEGNTDMTSKYAFYELKSEVGKMRQNVIVTCKHKLYGVINATSNEALHNNKVKVLSLIGNVKAHGSKNNLDISGDDVELNLNTGIVVSKGRAGFEYNFNKKSLEESNSSESDVKEEVIKEFEDEISSVKNISNKYEGIDNESIFPINEEEENE